MPDWRGARLRRAAALFRGRAYDAAHRRPDRAGSARRHPPQPDYGGHVPLQSDRRLPARFGRLPPDRRRDRRRRRSGGAEAEAGRRARGRQTLRHRLRRLRRAEPVEHGLYLDPQDRPGARARRAEGRRRRLGHRGGRRPGLGQRHRRFGAPGPGPSDGAGPDRRRPTRADPGRHRRVAGYGHGQGRLVDRGRQLFLPLRAGLGERGAPGRRAGARKDGAYCGGEPERAGRRCRIHRRQHPRRQQSGQRHSLLPHRRAGPLVAVEPAGRCRARHPRNRHVERAGTDADEREGRDQHLARLRLRLRFLRRGDRSGHRRRDHRQICLGPRLRHHPEPRSGRGADPGLLGLGLRRDLPGGVLLRGRRHLPLRHLRGISRADRRRTAGHPTRPSDAQPVALHPPRRQGHRRRQPVYDAGVRCECGGGRTGPRRYPAAAAAGPGSGVAPGRRAAALGRDFAGRTCGAAGGPDH